MRQNKTFGIDNKVLDRINIYLRYDTFLQLRPCDASIRYWRTKRNKRRLKITARNISCFRKQRDDKTGDSSGKVDVEFWLTADLAQDVINFHKFYITRNDTKEMERYLKAILLCKFDYETYCELGGCFWKEGNLPTDEYGYVY